MKKTALNLIEGLNKKPVTPEPCACGCTEYGYECWAAVPDQPHYKDNCEDVRPNMKRGKGGVKWR